LAVDHFVQVLLEVGGALKSGETQFLNDSHESGLKPFQIPVLVNDLVDDSSLENLVCLVSEQEHQVVHQVYLLTVLHVLLAPLR